MMNMTPLTGFGLNIFNFDKMRKTLDIGPYSLGIKHVENHVERHHGEII